MERLGRVYDRHHWRCCLVDQSGLRRPLNIQTESYRIPAANSGVELYIRNKHRAGVSNFPAEKICFSCTVRPIRPKRLSTCR